MQLSALVPLLLLLPPMPPGGRTADISQAMLDLRSNGVAMNVSAHPDDEDGATLAYERMRHGAKTYSVFFTRGEGGQNEKGPELYEELGVLRTDETRAAATLQGTEAVFLNLRDFGYSKTATETFAKWGGRQEVLRRLVYAFRRYKPDVVFTNHNTATGHGHHQAAAITAIAAFDAAADSAMFPEQLREPGMDLWQPKKLFFRIFQGSERPDVVNAVGDTDRVRGMTYLDIAAEALRRHETQGMDRADLRRWSRGVSQYRLVRASGLFPPDSTSFFGGIDLWGDPGPSLPPALRREAESLARGEGDDALLASCARLVRVADSALARDPGSAERRRILGSIRDEADRLASLVAGVEVSAVPEDPLVVPGQQTAFSVAVRADASVDVRGVTLELPPGWIAEREEGSTGRKDPVRFRVRVPPDAALTLPRAAAQYGPLGGDRAPRALARWRHEDAEFGTLVTVPVDVVAPEAITLSHGVVRIDPADAAPFAVLSYVVTNHRAAKTAGRLRLVGPPGWSIAADSYAIAHEDSSTSGVLTVRPPAGVAPGSYAVRIASRSAEAPLTVRVFPVAVAAGRTVGIVQSYDTSMASAVRELDVPFRLLSRRDLEGDLSAFASVIVDIRAYLVREDLRELNGRLLRWVEGGGTLVVMYQREQEWRREFAPFPFDITRTRVTLEEAPVTMLLPDHPLLSRPNRIVPSDWEDWVQERLIYAPGGPAPEYLRLVSTGDPGEPPVTTAFLAAPFGRGAYVYTSLVWYRQLKELHPGALRCFANMISWSASER